MKKHPLAEMSSLGTTSAGALVDVGIESPESLRNHGPVLAFKLLRSQFGKRVTISWIYALECAVRDLPWQNLDIERKIELKEQATNIIAELESNGSK